MRQQKMVYYTKTLEPCHSLTEAGEIEYHRLLEEKADEILFRNRHPLKYWWRRLSNYLSCGNSTWDGVHYSESEKYKDGYSYSN